MNPISDEVGVLLRGLRAVGRDLSTPGVVAALETSIGRSPGVTELS